MGAVLAAPFVSLSSSNPKIIDMSTCPIYIWIRNKQIILGVFIKEA